MPDRKRLESDGWLIVDGVDGPSAMIDLAHSIGQPIASPSGAIIRRIQVRSVSDARPQTLSAAFGTSTFPLHTDTAFWSIPAQFLVLRAYGDVRRQTTLLRFRDLIGCGLLDANLIKRSVWNLRTPAKSEYCLMHFRSANVAGLRFDPQCMFPANAAAKLVKEDFDKLQTHDLVEQAGWSGRNAVVLANWHVLHGRGPEPFEEGERILERIYVGAAR